MLLIGVSHRTAPIEVREKLAFSSEHVPDALNALSGQLPLEEVALLSTCNRTEIYCSTTLSAPMWVNHMTAWWRDYLKPTIDLTPYLYFYTEKDAVKHMLRVASGLDSMILGEPQILGQLKTAFRTSSQMGAMGRKLSRVFQLSFSTAKKIRATTQIAQHPVSIAYAAVSLAKQIFSSLSTSTVVLIGAGENSELILQHLHAKHTKRIIVVNRTLEKAQALAARYEIEARSLDSLEACLTEADVVVSSISSSTPIITSKMMTSVLRGTKRRPLLMIDLGVPRNIEPIVAQNEDIYLYSVDDLEGMVQKNLKERETAAIEAELIIEKTADDYMNWASSQVQIDTIRELRKRVERIKYEALEKAYSRLDKGQDPKKVLEVILHQLTQKMMHYPTVNLRKEKPEKANKKILLTKELFNLE